MKIRWLAHASFLIEGDGLRIITDPYEPNEIINLPPVTETADIVVRSSDDDEAHCFIETIPPGFELVTATDIVDTGATVKNIKFNAIWSEESHIHKEVVRDNAMYRFMLEGIHVTHMGDVGNPLTTEQMEALEGTDILLALVGGPPTIELPDLHEVIAHVKPKIVIPMHYKIPGPRFHMLPVTDFTSHYPEARVDWLRSAEVEFSKESLPEETRIVVLQPTLFRDE
jgi:L-ascorbate metabolism protein UlaG (beta-lactamase superfamily)